MLDRLSIGLDLKNGGVQIYIPPKWLDSHSRGLEDVLNKCQRTRHNEKRDVLVFTDKKTGIKAYQVLWARKSSEYKWMLRQRLLKKGGDHTEQELYKLWQIQEGKRRAFKIT